tara:strand:+ start:29401 stop:30276 length:876 start_codon:yes stop_codon:yes gene_type:complete
MTEQETIQKREAEFIKLIINIAVFVLLVVGVTFGIFFDFTPSKELKTWVDTATIFTGVATPILSTVSVFLLYFVWKDNRRELAETKKALSEQSDTQNFSVIKDAVFDVAEKVKESLQSNVGMGQIGEEVLLVSESSPAFKIDYPPKPNGEEGLTIMKLEFFLEYYFRFSREKPIESTRYNNSLKGLILSAPTLQYIDKVKSIALFMKALKSDEFKEVLEITLFAKLTIFTWLMFVEIAYHLLKTAKEGEQDIAELVFIEIAGLTCRQLKAVAWLNALSDEVLFELQKRKLI